MTINIDILMASISAGEDTELELKEVVFKGKRFFLGSASGGGAAASLAEEMVSMANTSGGRIVLGVRDSDRVPIGIDPDKRELVEGVVVGAASENCVPSIAPRLNWEFLPGNDGESKLCLIVEIPASRFDVHQTKSGKYLERIGSHKRLIPAERLARLLSSRRLTSPVEERPVLNAKLTDLDEVRLSKYFRSRFSDWETPEDWQETLVSHKLAVVSDDQVHPTYLGILLFAEQPDVFIPDAYVDMALYEHDEPDGNTSDTQRIVGPIPEQIEQALAWLRISPLNPTVSVKDGDGRHDYITYSDFALQEAVVNAIAHRDYEIRGSQVIIRMFPDRVEFQNPGALHDSLTIENLYAGCQPMRRNQLLAGYLRNYKSPVTGSSYMEARGEGFLNLVRTSERISGRQPVLERIGEATKLTIFGGVAAKEAMKSEEASVGEELSDNEIMVLTLLAGETAMPGSHMAVETLKRDAKKEGLENLGFALAYRRLERKGLVETGTEEDERDDYQYQSATVTSDGWDWLEAHESLLKLRGAEADLGDEELEDDIPF